MKRVTNDPVPSRLMLKLFRWFCHPDFREEIEGDLLEQFHLNVEEYGLNQAKWHFVLDVLLLLRPEVMGNFYQLTFHPFLQMKTSHWVKLIGLNVLFVAIMLMRFVPGPPNQIVTAFSVFGLFGGVLGLILCPLSLIWGIVEFQKLKHSQPSSSSWRTGYYFAIAAAVICALYFLFALALIITESAYALLPSAIVLGLALLKIIPDLKKMRQAERVIFNPTPLYLFSIPLITLLAHAFLVVPVSDFSRQYAIKRTEPLIRAIENYKIKEGHYPDAITDLQPAYLHKIPRPAIMGSEQFWYEKTADTYHLSFPQHLGATEEWVVYNSANQYYRKGYFASFEAKAPNWRYYWFD